MKIGLFVPCYVDALYPEVGVAAYKLLCSLGLDVEYPEKQTCCGQPMGNAGFQNKAEKLVENYDELFRGYDYVVAPSASCAAYVRFFHDGIVIQALLLVLLFQILPVLQIRHLLLLGSPERGAVAVRLTEAP